MSLYVKEAGDSNKPLLVFLHGGGVSGWMWDKQVRYFQDRYSILVPDLPGHGNSANVRFISIRDTAAEIMKLIKERRNGRDLTIVGFSLGAQIALEMLGLDQATADRAVIVSGLVKPMKTTWKLLKPLTHLSMPLMKSRTFAKLQARVLYIRDEDFEFYYTNSRQMDETDLLTVLEENMSFGIPHGYTRSGANLLVLVGGKEKKAMLESAKLLAQSHPNGTGYAIPKVGHGISLANSDLFHRILDSWMSEQELPSELNPI
ncbi:alpha/beta fold hydrolase [Paenibacillus sp. GCM10012303]|uniref:alpha/beta fold hydrolase n=1 Tax=Paenibacillus sp. GCM10012303 TaxID=3317340 RepID=UPI0036188953